MSGTSPEDEASVRMPDSAAESGGWDSPGTVDATEPVEWLLRDLRSSRSGLSTELGNRLDPGRRDQQRAFFLVLIQAGWHPGDATGPGSPLHHAYLQATTMTFLSMVVAQIGTEFAARTERASLRSVGAFSNRPLLAGIALELALTAAIIYLPPLQRLLSTAPLPPHLLW